MEGELVSCASKLLNPFLDPIVKEIHHTVQYRERIKGLKVEVLNLKKGRDKVESSVKEGEEKFGSAEFDTMVMVDVAQSLNVETIQEDIAKKLGWQLTETDVNERAARLLDSLKRQTRSVLVILDHVWETINLRVIGIPFGFEEKFVEI
ncbi:hypothetical protein Patl1_11765 [Pistacia atlantica]|uniref:Uncharacterized protein n=1 Tax=Pistacia atlantica TaxID=434234 RepID=A0ACC1A723_9ROSI|nr:hypothetical protein Patl1_11765 [Pistacia atlantica]